jgi:hypothetical protein
MRNSRKAVDTFTNRCSCGAVYSLDAGVCNSHTAMNPHLCPACHEADMAEVERLNAEYEAWQASQRGE